MLFNMEKVLIITKEQFNNLITSIGCNITIEDPIYLLTYLFVNLFAWVMIYLLMRIILTLFFEIFSKKRMIGGF